MRQQQKLYQVKSDHAELVYLYDVLEATRDDIAACKFNLPDSVIKTMEDDILQRSLAMKSIADKADLHRRARSNVSFPSLDIRAVVAERAKLLHFTDTLTERQDYLASLSALPVDLETVLLESETLSRQLGHLQQHRKDLYRSLRH